MHGSKQLILKLSSLAIATYTRSIPSLLKTKDPGHETKVAQMLSGLLGGQ